MSKCVNVSDDAFALLSNVDTLDITDCTQISDAAFEHMKNVSSLTLSRCYNVTEDAFLELDSLRMLDMRCSKPGEVSYSLLEQLLSAVAPPDISMSLTSLIEILGAATERAMKQAVTFRSKSHLVAEFACRALHSAVAEIAESSDSRELRDVFFTQSSYYSGDFCELVGVLKAYPRSAVIAEHACAVLYYLSIDESNRTDMAECEAVVLAAIAQHVSNTNVAYFACSTLSNLATTDSEYYASKETLSLMLSAREEHPTSEAVTECACVMIGCGSWFAFDAAAAAEYASIAMEAMAAFPRSKRLMSSACFALRNLSRTEEGAERVAAAGGAAAFVAGFSILPQENRWEQFLYDWCAHNVGAGLLGLSTVDEGRTNVIAAGGIAALAELAKLKNPYILENVTMALESFADEAVGRAAVAAAGVNVAAMDVVAESEGEAAACHKLRRIIALGCF